MSTNVVCLPFPLINISSCCLYLLLAVCTYYSGLCYVINNNIYEYFNVCTLLNLYRY